MRYHEHLLHLLQHLASSRKTVVRTVMGHDGGYHLCPFDLLTTSDDWMRLTMLLSLKKTKMLLLLLLMLPLSLSLLMLTLLLLLLMLWLLVDVVVLTLCPLSTASLSPKGPS